MYKLFDMWMSLCIILSNNVKFWGIPIENVGVDELTNFCGGQIDGWYTKNCLRRKGRGGKHKQEWVSTFLCTCCVKLSNYRAKSWRNKQITFWLKHDDDVYFILVHRT